MPAEQRTVYEICLAGHLDHQWRDWFEGMTLIQHQDGTTRLIGAVDQAGLHGLFKKIRDIGAPLIFVVPTDKEI